MKAWNNNGPPSLRRRILSLPTLVSFAVAAAFVYFLATRFDVDWSKMWANVREMNVGYYLLAIFLYYLSFGFRGLRWRILAVNAGLGGLPNATVPTALAFSQLVIIGWFVNAVAWLRLGDPYRAYAFSQHSGGGFSWSLGTILAERVLDMVTVFLLIVVGVAWFSITRDSTGAGQILLVALSMALALGAVLAIRVMRGDGARLARFLPSRLEPAYHRFEKGALASLKRLPLLFVLGLIAWLLEVGRLYLVVQALDIEIGLAHVLIVALAHAMLSTVPTPGGVGAVEPGVTGLLLLDMVEFDAVSVALVDRSITYLSVIVFGGLAFLLWQATHERARRNALRASEVSSAEGRLADV